MTDSAPRDRSDERSDEDPRAAGGDASEEAADAGIADGAAEASVDETADESTEVAAVADAADEHRRPSDASVPAIVATVALVIFSVFIGVYGPRLGNRQQLPGGTTLVELAGALSAKHSTEALGTIELLRDEPREAAAIEREARELLGRAVELPELQGRSVSWLRLTRIRVPGAAGVQVLLRIGPRFNAEFASIFILRDEDRFTVFDAYGRPRAMPEGEMFSVGVSGEGAGSVVHLFRAGDLVYGTESTDREVADELIAELQVLAARSLANP
ncbi:MAG: hypothetical protein RLY21_57 [Planctomycetota bacterium]